MARTAVQMKPKANVVATDAVVASKPVKPLTLPKHLKPLTGPTGPRRAY
jgi:hypothetical protein